MKLFCIPLTWKIIFLIGIFHFTANRSCFAQESKVVEKREQLERLEKKIINQKNELEKLNKEVKENFSKMESLNKMSDYNISNSGNVITYTSYVLAIFSIILTIFGIGVGFLSYKNYEKITQTEKEVNDIHNAMNTKLGESNTAIANIQSYEVKINNDINGILERIKTLEDDLAKKFENSIKIIPLYNEAYDNMNLGNLKQAIKNYEEILEIEENNIKATGQLVMCYDSLGEHAKALIKISEILNKDAKNGFAYYIKGVVLRRMKEYDNAIESLNESLKFGQSKNHSIYSHIAYSYMFKKDYENALNYFTKAMDIDDKNPTAYYGKVKINFLKSKVIDTVFAQTTIELSKRTISLNHKFPYPYFGIAFTQMLSNDSTCKDTLHQAVYICKNLGILQEQLSEYYFFKENVAKGLKYITESIKVLENAIDKLK